VSPLDPRAGPGRDAQPVDQIDNEGRRGQRRSGQVISPKRKLQSRGPVRQLHQAPAGSVASGAHEQRHRGERQRQQIVCQGTDMVAA
jgi:hypothetical protein